MSDIPEPTPRTDQPGTGSDRRSTHRRGGGDRHPLQSAVISDRPIQQPRQAEAPHSQPRGHAGPSTTGLVRTLAAIAAILTLAACGASKHSASSEAGASVQPEAPTVSKIPATTSPRAITLVGRALFYRQTSLKGASSTTDQNTVYEEGSRISLWSNGALAFLLSKDSTDYRAFFCGHTPESASQTVCQAESTPVTNNVFAFMTDAYLHPFSKDTFSQAMLQVTTTDTERFADVSSKCEIGTFVGGGPGKVCAALDGGYLTYESDTTGSYLLYRSANSVPRYALSLPAGAVMCKKGDPLCP